MPKVIKYSTTTPSGSLRKGNMAIGAGSYDYGTSFYTAVDPPDGGYTVYENKATGGPSIRVANNDSELINLTREASGTTYATAAECLAWFATQNDKLVISSEDNYKNIVTSGSVLNLDASVLSSYPTSGTTWYDISGGNNNGSLINGPTFDSNGAIVFDGADDYVDVPLFLTGSNPATLNMWVLTQDTSTDRKFVAKGSNASGGQAFTLTTEGAGIRYRHIGGYINYGAGTLTTNTWYNITAVIPTGATTTDDVKMYINSTEYLGVRGFGSTQTLNIGNDYSILGKWSTTNSFLGSIAITHVYNQALSPQEIQQNYFQAPIVTDGLVLVLDASNLVSYESGSTTTYSLTGSLSGSLINGTGFNRNNGGSWDFDGTNDYIQIDNVQDFTNNPSSELGQFTVIVWAKSDTSTWNDSGMLISRRDQFIIHPDSGTSNVRFFINAYGSSWESVQISNIPNINQYHQYAMTFNRINANGQVKAYLDGEFYTENSFGVLTSNTGPITVGRDDGLSRYFNGKIGTVQIYDRYLTDQEIQQNFNAQRNRFGI